MAARGLDEVERGEALVLAGNDLLGRSFVVDDGIDLDLDQHVGSDQARDLDHGRDGRVFREALGVCPTELLPARDVGDKHACTGHVVQLGADVSERSFDDLEAALGLRVGVAEGVGLALGVERDGTGDKYEGARSQGAAIADLLLPRGSTVGTLT